MEELLKLFEVRIQCWPDEFEREAFSIPGYANITSMYIGIRLLQEYEDDIDLHYPSL